MGEFWQHYFDKNILIQLTSRALEVNEREDLLTHLKNKNDFYKSYEMRIAVGKDIESGGGPKAKEAPLLAFFGNDTDFLKMY